MIGGIEGQISPNSDVILSIIDWLLPFDSTILSIKKDEKYEGDGGVNRLTIGIGLLDTTGDIDVDEDGEWGGVGTNEQVDNVRLIVSRWITCGENDEQFLIGDDGDEHKQWPNDVTVFIIVKRRGICDDDDDEFDDTSSFRQIESFNNLSFES